MLKQDIVNELNKKNLQLATRIRSENNIAGSSDLAYSFIITGLKLLFPIISDNKLKYSIIDNYNDGDFDAIIFKKNKKKIYIFNFTITPGFNYKDVKSLKDNIELLLLNPRQSLSGLDTNVSIKINIIRKLIHKGWKLSIYIIRGGSSNILHSVENLMATLKNNFPVIDAYYFLNLDSLVNKALDIESQQNYYEWDIHIEPGNNSPTRLTDVIIIRDRNGGSIKSMFVRINLKEIVKLQKKFIDNNQDLFDANVRDFQKSKRLSNKIINTVKYNPHSFYIFHNGLTFSCSEIEPIDVCNYKIICPQIINGCQTVSTIYDAYKERLNDKNLRRASILCKFYSLEFKMIEKVCEATNTQLKIDLWDLRSNDEIQRIFELALKVKGIDYKRKITNRIRSRVFISDLAQWLYSCRYEKPAEAKNKKSNLFDLLITDSPYSKIFNERIKLETLARICEIAFFIQGKIKKIGKTKLPFGKDADLHFLAAIFQLENKTWSLDRKFSCVRRIIEAVVREMRKIYGRDISFNKIFTKKIETWDSIKQKLSSL